MRQHPVEHETTPIFVPNKYDVMFGSGHSVFNHPGNVLFRSIVEKRAEDYGNAPCKLIRSRVVKSILSEVRATCGHVLKKDPIFQFWHVANNAEKALRDKTTHYLRGFLARKSRGVQYAPQVKYDHGKQQDSNNGMLPLFQLQYASGSSDHIPVRTIQEMKESPPLPLSNELQSLDPWMALLCRFFNSSTLEDEPPTKESTDLWELSPLSMTEENPVDKRVACSSFVFFDKDYNENDSDDEESATIGTDLCKPEQILHPDSTHS